MAICETSHDAWYVEYRWIEDSIQKTDITPSEHLQKFGHLHLNDTDIYVWVRLSVLLILSSSIPAKRKTIFGPAVGINYSGNGCRTVSLLNLVWSIFVQTQKIWRGPLVWLYNVDSVRTLIQIYNCG